MTYLERWDELKHSINCAINFNEHRMKELSEEIKKHVDAMNEPQAKNKADLLVRHWHNVQELKCVQTMMEDIERMEEEEDE